MSIFRSTIPYITAYSFQHLMCWLESWEAGKQAVRTVLPSQVSNFVKIDPVGTELFHADRRTDVTKPIVAVRNFANALKNANNEKNEDI